MKRIGILAGTFDPIHEGHVAFALAAIDVSNLDKVIFITESKPRGKDNTTSLKHRLKMIELALKPFPKLQALVLGEDQFTVSSTWPKIQQTFKGADLYLLAGSDIAKSISKWPDALVLQSSATLVRGERAVDKKSASKGDIVIYTNFADLSSSKIRAQIAKGKLPHGLNSAVANYIKTNNLYVVGSASAA